MTKFSDLYPFIRALLGDYDERKQLYKDAAIDSQLRLRILVLQDTGIQETDATRVFTEDLSAATKALLVYQTAKAILSPSPDSFAYRDPVVSVSRRGGVTQLMAYLDEQLNALQGGAILVKSDTDLQAILNGATRFYDDYAEALVE